MSDGGWLSFANLDDSSFPIEIFAYPETPEDSTEILWYVCLNNKQDEIHVPLPASRLRLKVVLADGQVLLGSENEDLT